MWLGEKLNTDWKAAFEQNFNPNHLEDFIQLYQIFLISVFRNGSLFFRPHRTELYHDVPSACWPIVYSPDYNITFMGLEKLHPFDAGKWGKVINFLKGKNNVKLFNKTDVLGKEL